MNMNVQSGFTTSDLEESQDSLDKSNNTDSTTSSLIKN